MQLDQGTEDRGTTHWEWVSHLWPVCAHSGSTVLAQAKPVRMELSRLASRVGGEGAQPVWLVPVSVPACRWGLYLAFRSTPAERDNLGSSWERVSEACWAPLECR